MPADQIQLPLYDGPSERRSAEERTSFVRGVEFCSFPRAQAGEEPRSGCTRDVSASGMCLRVKAPEPTGQLLRVVVHCIDGRAEEERIVRVAWCRPVRRGSPVHLMGVTFVEAVALAPRAPAPAPAETGPLALPL